MRVVCALETSARPPSVALRVGSEELARELAEARRHASDLLPTLARMLEERGVTPRDLELVCVGVGPGSYTGLRVGIATALGLARGAGAEVVGVPSVEALAFDLLEPGEEGTVLLDARARELYVARYRRDEGGVTELLSPRVTTAGARAGGPAGRGAPAADRGPDPGGRDRGRGRTARRGATRAAGRRTAAAGGGRPGPRP